MTTHELARKLLEGPDLPAVIHSYGSNDYLQYTAVENIEALNNEDYASGWVQGKYPAGNIAGENAGQTAPWMEPIMKTGDVIAILG